MALENKYDSDNFFRLNPNIAANRHLTFGAQVLTYDLNGNLLNDGTSGYTNFSLN